MKANLLTINNFRGSDNQTLDLTGVDVLTGANGIGKTRILQALQLAVSGVVPHSIEDRNIEAIELFTRQLGKMDMHVGLSFDSGASFERIFNIVMKKDLPSVTQSIGFTADGVSSEVGSEEGGRQIRNLLGDFPYMLDIHKFIRLSDEKRAELIMKFGAFDAEKWNPATVRTSLFEHVYTYLLDVSIAEAAMKAVAGPMKLDVRTGLIALMEWLKKEQSNYKKEIKQFSATSQGAAKMLGTDGKSSMRPAETIREELATARADWTTLNQQIATARSGKEQYGKMQTEGKEIDVAIRAIRTVASKEKIADLEAQNAAIMVAILPEGVLEQEEALKLAIEENENDVALKKEHVMQGETNLKQLQAQAELLKDGKCPTCGQQCADVFEGYGTAIDNTNIEIQDNRDTLAQFEATMARNKDSLIDVMKQIGDSIIAFENAAKLKSGLDYQIDLMREKIASIATQENRLQVIRNYKYEDSLNLDESQLQLDGLTSRGNALNAELEKRVEYDTEIRLAKESAQKRAETEFKAKTIAELLELTKSFRWDIVRQALAPIKEKVAALFTNAAILSSGPVTFDFMFLDARQNECFKFGWRTSSELGEMFIDFDSLSTSQQLFTLVSVLSPLIELGNPKFKCLLLDNVEVIEESNRPAFLSLLVDAQRECNLDNVLVASSGEFPEALGVNVVNLNKERIAA